VHASLKGEATAEKQGTFFYAMKRQKNEIRNLRVDEFIHSLHPDSSEAFRKNNQLHQMAQLESCSRGTSKCHSLFFQ
jgi:3'-phosphoadenosine 5'-phosphosulfate sulfotransferase